MGDPRLDKIFFLFDGRTSDMFGCNHLFDPRKCSAAGAKTFLVSSMKIQSAAESSPLILSVLTAICATFSIFTPAAGAADEPAYRDSRLPAQTRADDLLARMTLEEKVEQLRCLFTYEKELAPEGTFVPEKAAAFLGNGIGELGPIRWETRKEVALRNAIQKFLVEKTRLGIPALFHEEGCHGVLAPGATSFPVPIGLASAWDESLTGRVFAATAEEMRARGIHHALTPVIDICRDPRWGRTDEMFGEDPYLNGRLGVAAVKGFQGGADGRVADGHVAATLKHLAGHGQPEGGINRAPSTVPLRELLDAHLLPFRMAVREARPVFVMPSYNEVDGVPSHANAWLLQDVLRKEFGFTGIVASDYEGVGFLQRVHAVTGNPAEAALRAFEAGVEMDLPFGEFFRELKPLVEQNKIPVVDLNAAVRKVLVLKFELGLFENPYADAEAAIDITKRESTAELALEAARKSIVLLKNDGILPIAPGRFQTTAVVGPNANDTRTGTYSGEPWHKVTLLDGIRKRAGSATRVVFAEGCKVTKDLPASSMLAWNEADSPVFATDEENKPLIDEAVRVAKDADLIVLAIGENETIARESWSKKHVGDRASLELFGSQAKLADAMLSLGKPVVVYLMNGRPLAIGGLLARANAVLEGWYMGQGTGTAAADILFGDVNPSGKLTISFPRSAGHVPAYYNRKPGARIFDYADDSSKPLLPFGSGLSYTTFKYSAPKVSAPSIKQDGTLTVSADVTNTGKVAGDEIVQLYLRDDVSSVTRPVRELRGFMRVHLEPGETKTVAFPVTFESLAFHDIRMDRVVEPGTFKAWIAPDSNSGTPVAFEVVE